MALCPKCGSSKVERYTDHGLSCTACGHDGATVEFAPDLRSDETKAVDDRVAKARADERERCAKIADAHAAQCRRGSPVSSMAEDNWGLVAARDIAAAIRNPSHG